MTDQFATNAGVLDWGLRLRTRSSASQRMIGSPWHWFFGSQKIKGHSDNRMLHLLAQIHQYPLKIIESCTAGLEKYGLDCKPKLRRTNHTKQVARFFVMGSRFCVGSLCLWSRSIHCTKLPWGLSRRCKAWQHISAPGSQKVASNPMVFVHSIVARTTLDETPPSFTKLFIQNLFCKENGPCLHASPNDDWWMGYMIDAKTNRAEWRQKKTFPMFSLVSW